MPLANHITYLDKSSFEKQKQTTAMTFGRRWAFKEILFLSAPLLPGKDNGVTSSSDGRALHDSASGVPSPAGLVGLPLNTKYQQHSVGAVSHLAMERDSSHDSMVSSTSNLPSSSESQGSDAASVLLYQSSNSGKDPRLWNVQEVTNFMYSIGCSNYAEAFVKEVCISLVHRDNRTCRCEVKQYSCF